MKLWKKFALSAASIAAFGLGLYFAYPSIKSSISNIIERKKEQIIYGLSNMTPAEEISTKNIMSWNLQAFGTKKARDSSLMQNYREVITNADIAFLQEIRDASGKAVEELKQRLPEYNFWISSRAGRSESKEQYGVLYRKPIEVLSITDFNPDKSNRWERPPVLVNFKINDYTLRVYNIHLKPTEVKQEMSELEKTVLTNGNIVIFGDLNASGSYYNRQKEKQFMDWKWIIKDSDDTTLAKSANAYDRILMNKDAYKEYFGYSIYTNTTPKMSDHYPIFFKIKAKESN
jgi:endonuclease/exonuclease/phosphatase family metal-dependent hydrolase